MRFERRDVRAIRQNIDAICKLEETAMQARTAADRIADAIRGFSGSLKFVVLHLAVYGCWIFGNMGLIPGFPIFDRYPFVLLSMVVSLEAIFLSTFVLMKQNRMSKRADQRAHLDLQINLLAEQEMTMVLRILQKITGRLGLRLSDDEIEELAAETSVEQLASELQEKLPD